MGVSRRLRRQGFTVVLIAALGAAALPAFGGDAASPARDVLERFRGGGAWDAAAAAQALGPASPRRIAELRLLLGDGDAFIRGAAVQALALFGDHPVLALVRLLDDEAEAVRLHAEEALVGAGPAAVEPLGEVLLTASCLSPSITAAARILGKIGDPAGAPHLANVLVKYRTGGFPPKVALEALRAVGGPAAVAQLLQLTAFKELGEQSHRVLMGMDRASLARSVGALLDDGETDPEVRFAYAMQLNEIAGSVAGEPVLVKFFGEMAEAADLPPEARKRGASLKHLFTGISERSPLFRAPLSQERLAAMYAAGTQDEESPFIEARRKQEREMEAIREERRRAAAPRGAGRAMIWSSDGARVHTVR